MSERPAPLTQTAERRTRERALDVRGPVSRSIGRAGATRQRDERERGEGLTLRERRVKKILLKELEKIRGKGKSWQAHKERQHLGGRLDVEFIDREIAKMEKGLRSWPKAAVISFALAAIYCGLMIAQVVTEPLTWFSFVQVALGFVMVASAVYGPIMTRRATERRLWIYQALRELSDADDMDVQLPESVALADLLIDRIVEAEDEASRVPLRRVRA